MDVLALDAGHFWSQWLWPILQFVIGLGLVVFVHELGHFLAAKWAGVRVEKFALGFGPALLSFGRGETKYCVNLVPLGGYVKMTGQDDMDPSASAPEDPRSWQRARYSRRLVILSAGVCMNVFYAALVFVIVYLIGIRFTAPVIGGVAPDTPAAKADLPPNVAELMAPDERKGLRPGDRVEAINGRHIRRWEEVAEAGILSGAHDVFRLTIRRPIGDRTVTFDTTLKPAEQDNPDFGRYYAFGIEPAGSNIIRTPSPVGYAGPERFARGDRIVAIHGRPASNEWDIRGILRDLPPGGPVDVTVERHGRRIDMPLKRCIMEKLKKGDGDRLLDILGMSSRVAVGRVFEGEPADKAGVQPGDVFIEYDGTPHPTRQQINEITKANADQDIDLKLLRDGEVVETVVRPRNVSDTLVLIGVDVMPDSDSTVVAGVTPDSPAARAGLLPGGTLTKVNDATVANWADVIYALQAAGNRSVSLTWTRDGGEKTAEVGTITEEQFDPAGYLLMLPAIKFSAQTTLETKLIRGHPGQAVVWAVQDTLRFLRNVYSTLRLMATRRVGFKGMQGPAGIGQFAVLIARESSLKLVYFMAMLSVMIAAFNFLPLPVLDGGHVVLVTIEKLRGRALPTKLVAWIQTVGLVALLGLFLLITWQDILRMIR